MTYCLVLKNFSSKIFYVENCQVCHGFHFLPKSRLWHIIIQFYGFSYSLESARRLTLHKQPSKSMKREKARRSGKDEKANRAFNESRGKDERDLLQAAGWIRVSSHRVRLYRRRHLLPCFHLQILMKISIYNAMLLFSLTNSNSEKTARWKFPYNNILHHD